jgi:phosphohistidine phosphatase
MRLSFLRHGIAANRTSPEYENDSERPLTPKGERRMRRAAKGIQASGQSYDLILSSPYLRAKQTAEIVAQVVTTPEGVMLAETLTPEGNPRQLIEELCTDHHERQDVLLVGHEPYLSRLISTLLTGNPNLSIELKRGALCTLSAEALRFGRCASLISLLSPRQLRRLA